MKIAIQGHPTRGKEIIQILESLGGNNLYMMTGSRFNYYYINNYYNIDGNSLEFMKKLGYTIYTLEEFEKEFPFKVGDIVLSKATNNPHKIVALEWFNNKLCYKLDSRLHYAPKALTTYKEMKEERNITLTLDKAKEWYNKGGELKEIALQAFTEKELNPLPRSWEEFCKQSNPIASWRYNIPTKYEALYQLEQLRDCYRGLFVTVIGMPVWNISMYDGKPHIFQAIWGKNQSFLSFQSRKVAEEYLENFEPLIEKAGDLIS